MADSIHARPRGAYAWPHTDTHTFIRTHTRSHTHTHTRTHTHTDQRIAPLAVPSWRPRTAAGVARPPPPVRCVQPARACRRLRRRESYRSGNVGATGNATGSATGGATGSWSATGSANGGVVIIIGSVSRSIRVMYVRLDRVYQRCTCVKCASAATCNTHKFGGGVYRGSD